MRFAVLTGLLILGYFATRLINLALLPIFTDEAIYIRWSQIGSRDAAWRFISLTDGKQPLFTWIMMFFLKLFPFDPLITGRLVSVCAGFISLIGIITLSAELFRNRTAALMTGLLYVISPFSMMYDRMALYDSLVAALFIWSLYISVRLVRTLRFDTAMVLGLILGAAMLNKSSGFFGAYLLPFTLLLFDWNKQDRLKRFFRWLGMVCVAVMLALGYYSILRLSPFFHMVSQKNTVFLYTFTEWIGQPLRFFTGNLKGMNEWLTGYLTIPIAILCIIPLFAFWSRFREKILLISYFIFPYIALAAFGKVLYPRFILFMVMPLYLLAGLAISRIYQLVANKNVAGTILMILLLPALSMSYFIITSPVNALIPESDKVQYINDWPSGGGIREVNAIFTALSKNREIAVYTDGTFGLLPYAIEIYQVDNPNVKIRGIWPVPKVMPDEISLSAMAKPTFLILNQKIDTPEWPIKLLASFDKGSRQDRSLRLYEIIPATAAAADADRTHL